MARNGKGTVDEKTDDVSHGDARVVARAADSRVHPVGWIQRAAKLEPVRIEQGDRNQTRTDCCATGGAAAPIRWYVPFQEAPESCVIRLLKVLKGGGVRETGNVSPSSTICPGHVFILFWNVPGL